LSKYITEKLQNKGKLFFTVFVIVSAFGAYSCIYGLRKPFTVGIYEGIKFFGIDYKIVLVISQVSGYMLAKIYGIKFISEMPKNKRAFTLILIFFAAELSLVLFGITPVPYNLFFMFLNGIPLGLAWGLIFSYLEGRNLTEILGAGLCAAFIVSSGFVKTIGKIIIVDLGTGEFLMPMITGAIFILPYLLFVWMLNKIPEPTKEEEEYKIKRVQMFSKDRKKFLIRFMPGLILLTLSYMLISGYRDFRDNFAADIWKSMGFGNQSSIFTTTEIIVALTVLSILSLIMLIKNNYSALNTNFAALIIGFIAIGGGTYLYTQSLISSYLWMVVNGFGAFMCYVPFNAILFDRLIAAFRQEGNSGFLIYFADSFGYLASIIIMLYKNFGAGESSSLDFFIQAGYIVMIFGGILILFSIYYFYKKQKELKV
jgi:MFS family permease